MSEQFPPPNQPQPGERPVPPEQPVPPVPPVQPVPAQNSGQNLGQAFPQNPVQQPGPGGVPPQGPQYPAPAGYSFPTPQPGSAPQAPYQAVQPGYQPPNVAGQMAPGSGGPEKKTLGVVALVLAVLGTILGCIKGIMVIGWILLPVAFVLAIVAIVKKAGRGLAIGALVLSIVGGLVSFGVLAYTVAQAVKEQSDEVVQGMDSGQADALASLLEDENADGSEDFDAEGDYYDPKATFDGAVFTGSGVKVEITGHRVVQPGEEGNAYGDKPIIVIEYTMTNVSAQEPPTAMDFDMMFEVQQDNDPNTVNTLSWGYDDTAYEKYGDTGAQAIKTGGSVPYAATYELDDLTTPVEIVPVPHRFGEPGTYTIPLG